MISTSRDAVDPTRCPICGGANGCALALATKGTCWCFSAPIDRSVREQVPVEAQGVACVCRRCTAGTREATPRA